MTPTPMPPPRRVAREHRARILTSIAACISCGFVGASQALQDLGLSTQDWPTEPVPASEWVLVRLVDEMRRTWDFSSPHPPLMMRKAQAKTVGGKDFHAGAEQDLNIPLFSIGRHVVSGPPESAIIQFQDVKLSAYYVRLLADHGDGDYQAFISRRDNPALLRFASGEAAYQWVSRVLKANSKTAKVKTEKPAQTDGVFAGPLTRLHDCAPNEHFREGTHPAVLEKLKPLLTPREWELHRTLDETRSRSVLYDGPAHKDNALLKSAAAGLKSTPTDFRGAFSYINQLRSQALTLLNDLLLDLQVLQRAPPLYFPPTLSRVIDCRMTAVHREAQNDFLKRYVAIGEKADPAAREREQRALNGYWLDFFIADLEVSREELKNLKPLPEDLDSPQRARELAVYPARGPLERALFAATRGAFDTLDGRPAANDTLITSDKGLSKKKTETILQNLDSPDSAVRKKTKKK